MPFGDQVLNNEVFASFHLISLLLLAFPLGKVPLKHLERDLRVVSHHVLQAFSLRCDVVIVDLYWPAILRVAQGFSLRGRLISEGLRRWYDFRVTRLGIRFLCRFIPILDL